MRFHRVCFIVMLLVSSGSPESRTQHYSVISRVRATGPRLPCANVVVCQVGMAGLEPASPCSQRPPLRGGARWVRRYPTSRFYSQSERADSNRRSPGPPPAARVPGRDNQASLRSAVSSSCGSRTRLCALKGRDPVPIDERAISARTVHAVDTPGQRARFTQWVGRCSNPRLRLFRPPPTNLRSVPASQLPTQRKKPDVVVTPGFRYSFGICAAECHMRNGYDGHRFAV